MKYTLYVDESGDFQSERGQWVLAGVLIPDDYVGCEKRLSKLFQTIPEDLGLHSIREFHLTEFRKTYGHSTAVDMARKVYRRLDQLPVGFHAVACINDTKTSLSSREKNYRLMLADLLAVCETVIPDDVVLTRLDLVVASRTIDGQLQTSISNINRDVIQSLPVALEVDLATKGLVDLMGKNIRIHMDYANNSWGLVCADFLANLNYNNRNKEEKEFLGELEKEGKYSIFESFGSFDVRRAHVAERNLDYVLALYRWVLIGYCDSSDAIAEDSIGRLLNKIFTRSGTYGYSVLFEALIEKLWRNNNKSGRFDELSKMLLYLDKQLSEYISITPSQNLDSFIFRLRNIRLIVENHQGRTKDAGGIVCLQKPLIATLATSPEYIQLVLDFKVAETELLINSLRVKEALALSVEYSSLVENYKGVWQLLLDDEDLSGFDSSRSSIKSEMTLFRSKVLCLPFDDTIIVEDIVERINAVEKVLTSSIDISRFRNYRVMLLLKLWRPKEAVDVFVDLCAGCGNVELSSFDLYWFLRSVNDVLLSSQCIDVERIKYILGEQVARMDLNSTGHPMDLVLRELATFEFQVGERSKALRYIAKSNKAFNLGESEISTFLKQVSLIHEDFIRGEIKVIGEYFRSLKNSEFVGSLLASDLDLPPIQKVRHFSIY